MNSNFDYYRVFYYVAKYGNLTKAAAALQTSQPAVTRTIHRLEDDLGCRLFVRSKTGMTLTAEGRTFYEYASAGCAQFMKGEQKLTNLLSLDEGSITISATETALHCCLLQAMEDFTALHPRVTFRILNMSSSESIRSLSQGRADMAMISSLPYAMEEPFVSHTVHTYTDILIGGQKYKDLREKTMTLAELSAYPWVSLTQDAITRRFLNTYFAEHGLPFHPAVELATTDLILSAIEHNLGIGFLPPEFASQALRAGGVFRIQIPEEVPARRILLVYDEEYPQSIAAAAFRRFLIEEFIPGQKNVQ